MYGLPSKPQPRVYYIRLAIMPFLSIDIILSILPKFWFTFLNLAINLKWRDIEKEKIEAAYKQYRAPQVNDTVRNN